MTATGFQVLATAQTIHVYARMDGYEISWLQAAGQDYLRHTCGTLAGDTVDVLIALSPEQMASLHGIYHEEVRSDAERDARFLRILAVLRQGDHSFSLGEHEQRHTTFNPDLESQFCDIDGYEPPDATTGG